MHLRARTPCASCCLLVLADAPASAGTRASQERGAGGRARLDFADFGATRALTAALLAEDFGVAWWLPEGHLCPTLTSRLNYIHWLEDLLALSPPPGARGGAGQQPQPQAQPLRGADVRGLDIGTGANAVYALLGAAVNGWCGDARRCAACEAVTDEASLRA